MSLIFLDYMENNQPLQFEVRDVFDELSIVTEQRKKIATLLKPLNMIHRPSYDHSLRVGLLCRAIGRAMHLSERALLYSGLLHDIGKALIAPETLSKTQGWNSTDTQRMHEHVMLGYDLLRSNHFDFTAEVVLWHHNFQKDGYPKIHPALLHDYSLGTQVMIPYYGRLLALADYYDALHRVNDYFSSTEEMNGEKIKKLMLDNNIDQMLLVEELYKVGVFTIAIKTPVPV